MIKVYEVSRKCIMLFKHNNRCFTFNWFTYFVAVTTILPAPVIFFKYFINISRNIS